MAMVMLVLLFPLNLLIETGCSSFLFVLNGMSLFEYIAHNTSLFLHVNMLSLFITDFMLTLKAQITTAADYIHKYVLIVFQRK